MHPPPTVILNVSINGVKLLHEQNKETLVNHDIKYISSVCQDQDEKNYFALVTKNDPDAYHYCHIFLCQNAQVSSELVITIGQTFDVCYEQYCKENII